MLSIIARFFGKIGGWITGRRAERAINEFWENDPELNEKQKDFEEKSRELKKYLEENYDEDELYDLFGF